MARRFWLLKSDPATFGWDDLKRAPKSTTCWDGVRNYQARNYLRDEMKAGDGVLFYHSQAERAIVGTAKIVKGGHPDPTQFDPKKKGYDPGSTAENPAWYAVDLQLVEEFAAPVTLDLLRGTRGLEGMFLLQKGSRLSVQPVTATQWAIVLKLGGAK